MALSYSPKIITDGLVLCLDAGDGKSYSGSGTTWTDRSGNSNNGTLLGGPVYSTDNGGTLTFDGSESDYVTIGSGSNYAYPYHTFEIWVNTPALGGNNLDGLFGLDYGRYVNITSGGQISYQLYYNMSAPNTTIFQITTSNINVVDGKWHHIICSRGTTNYEIWFDGILKKTGGNGGQPSWNGLNQWSSMTARIAENPNNVGYNYSGKIAAARMYNRQLASAEVLQNYNATKGRFGL
jgi:hypothetical protein